MYPNKEHNISAHRLAIPASGCFEFW